MKPYLKRQCMDLLELFQKKGRLSISDLRKQRTIIANLKPNHEKGRSFFRITKEDYIFQVIIPTSNYDIRKTKANLTCWIYSLISKLQPRQNTPPSN